jgi:UDP-glucuronate decarboxylase
MESAEGAGETVNLGSPEEMSVREIARRISALTGSDVPTETKPLPVDDPIRRCPDISKARTRLGWEPTTSIDEGLCATLDHFREELARPGRSTTPPEITPGSGAARGEQRLSDAFRSRTE